MTENQALPGVKIEVGNEQYTLLFSLYAFAKLKKVAQINALKGEVDFLDPDHILYFLWAGLITNHPEFDGELVGGVPDKDLSSALRKLGTHLTFDKMKGIGDAIRQAFANATGTGSKDDAKEPTTKGKKS